MFIVSVFCCVSCKKEIHESELVGRWVYTIDLPYEKTGLKGVKEASIEFRSDKTFKTKDIPAVIIVFEVASKGQVVTGSGTWKIDEDEHRNALTFNEVNGKKMNFGYSSLQIIDYIPFKDTKLCMEHAGSQLCFFYKSEQKHKE